MCNKTIGRIRQQFDQAQQQHARKVKRLRQITEELEIDELIDVLQHLQPSHFSKLKEAVHYLEAC